MKYYRDYPYEGHRVVRDLRGNLEYARNCKQYPDGQWYVKDKDLRWNGDDWVKKEDVGAKEGEFDYELGRVTEAPKQMIHGIVSVSKAGLETLGYFTPNPYKNCKVHGDGLVLNCISYAILKPEFYMERIAEGVYYRIAALNEAQQKEYAKKFLHIDNVNNTYNIEDNAEIFAEATKLYEQSQFPIDSDLKYAARYLGDITFGIELETITGTLPEYIRKTYGIIICKDGSLKDGKGKDAYPPEYVSVVYKGAKGLQSIRNVTTEIAKRSDIDIRCSYHLHLGGFALDRTLLVALYKLCQKTQLDVFKMFPGYKLNPQGYKQQNYCQLLPNVLSNYGCKDFNLYINESFCDLYTFLSGGRQADSEYNRKNKENPWGKAKWNIKTRYHWVNFINPIFGKRDTIEFRIHTPTLNADKIINWVFMCTAMIRYAQTYIKNCITNKPIAFTDVLKYYEKTNSTSYGARISENLLKYYEDRVAYFKKDAEAGDVLSPKELENDMEYKFNITAIQ